MIQEPPPDNISFDALQTVERLLLNMMTPDPRLVKSATWVSRYQSFGVMY
jgi:hypothetical protein